MESEDHVRTAADIEDEELTPQAIFDEIPTRQDLLAMIDQMQQDFVKLNEFLNRTAIYYSWCTDWEDRIYQYNRAMKVLKLEGREEHSSVGTSTDGCWLPSLRAIKRLRPEDQRKYIEYEKNWQELEEYQKGLEARDSQLSKRSREVEVREQRVTDVINRLRRAFNDLLEGRLDDPPF